MGNLTGNVAVITGAQQGIGRAVALAMAKEGAHVVVNYLDDAEAANETAAAARALGVKANAVCADISKPSDVEILMQAADEMGGVSILVNNAAVFPRSSFLELAESEWDLVLGVNLKGAFLCTQAAANRMVSAKQGGAIINLTSGAAFRGSPRGVHYVSSKAGVVGLTRATAVELAAHKIRVNAIAPGLTDTAQPRYGMTEDEISEKAATIPFPGLTMPEDIADAAVFLASDSASRISGQTIHVNGGDYLY
ncbi:MAG: SDR family NAD(P)-dependent oxidoreductase [Alphaproteobacteria bacterium]|jgi:NAD(P)-dependent dehydrogenase (short-subunit alcohol dehydrogenase family)|tara:strand:+ start:332 stop:1084 length:753 start_codon:yes stop_codon:yes gene_type:complete